MAIEIAFDKIADVYDAQRAHPPEAAITIGQAIVAQTGNGASVLEIGIGSGRIALPVAAAGANVIGIDISTGMLATARERAKEAGLPLGLIKADAQALPFADGVFDAVLAVHVLHLLPDWRAALAEMVRVVKPGEPLSKALIGAIRLRASVCCAGNCDRQSWTCCPAPARPALARQ